MHTLFAQSTLVKMSNISNISCAVKWLPVHNNNNNNSLLHPYPAKHCEIYDTIVKASRQQIYLDHICLKKWMNTTFN